MKLFDIHVTTTSVSKRAPRGMMWMIDSLIFNNFVTANNAIVVRQEWRDSDKQVQALPELTTDDMLEHNTDNTGNFQYIRLEEKTKYITVGRVSDGNTPDCMVYGYGRLINASRRELLIEWFRKAR